MKIEDLRAKTTSFSFLTCGSIFEYQGFICLKLKMENSGGPNCFNLENPNLFTLTDEIEVEALIGELVIEH